MTENTPTESPGTPDPLEMAIEAAGGVGKLAALLKIKNPSVVGNWRIRGQVPPERVRAIEAATGVSRHDLRPDVFGPPENPGARLPTAAKPGDAAEADGVPVPPLKEAA